MTYVQKWDYAVWLDCFDRGEPDEKCNIFLPHQSPLGIFEDQQRQPTGEWPAVFLCLGHGQSCVRPADSIRLDVEVLAPHQPMPPFWRIECECGHENCGKRHTIYTARMLDWPSIARRILKTNPSVPCDSHDLVWREELMWGTSFAHESPMR
jgi:hypothetical protein